MGPFISAASLLSVRQPPYGVSVACLMTGQVFSTVKVLTLGAAPCGGALT